MYAVEISGLTKSFLGLYALNGLDMHVPVGSVYGFIGENGSGKSTTEKIICGHLVPDSGTIRLFGRKYTDTGVRARVGALIENAGCFPESSIRGNLKMQAINLGIRNADEEIIRVLRIVRMDDCANLKFKKCSYGMKQRVGIAMALLGDPALLILDEPINGLDTEGVRMMREVITDITGNYGKTVLISSHILGELEKIATHYGIIRQGHMIREVTAGEMEKSFQEYVLVRTQNTDGAMEILKRKYPCRRGEEGLIRVDGTNDGAGIAAYLYANGHTVRELRQNTAGLEEYYTEIMKKEGGAI